MHDDQVSIDADIVRGMIVDQFPEYRHESIERLRTIGTDNAIFRIGSGVAARFPLRAMKSLECAEAEVDALVERLAAAVALPEAA